MILVEARVRSFGGLADCTAAIERDPTARGFRLIHGTEIRLADGPTLVLLGDTIVELDLGKFVAAGKNVLTLSVLGNVTEEEITDTDFLEFIVK